MKKRSVARKARANIEKDRPCQPSSDQIHRLRGKFRGKGLLKALLAEKKHEREL